MSEKEIKDIGSLKQAIIDYIYACITAIIPCEHNWELLSDKKVTSKLNTDYWYTEWTYRCKKCGLKNFLTDENEK